MLELAFLFGLRVTKNQKELLTDLLPHVSEQYCQYPRTPEAYDVTVRVDGQSETVPKIIFGFLPSREDVRHSGTQRVIITVIRSEGREINIEALIPTGANWLIVTTKVRKSRIG